jgi:hypothetical protein
MEKDEVFNLLQIWLEKNSAFLFSAGFKSPYPKTWRGGSTSIDLDSESIVGSITHWPPNTFEFQFNNARTGDVLILDTKTLETGQQLDTYISQMFRQIGITDSSVP